MRCESTREIWGGREDPGGGGGLPGYGQVFAPGGECRISGRRSVERYGGPTPEALVASAMRWIRQFEDWKFDNFKVSLKASDVLVTVAAYRQLSEEVDYPLHIGVTEAGGLIAGAVKSAWGWAGYSLKASVTPSGFP